MQGIRGTFHTKVENLFILAPHCHTSENTSDGRCDSKPDGSEAGFLHDHRTDHTSRLCDGPKVAHQSLEPKETTNYDNHPFKCSCSLENSSSASGCSQKHFWPCCTVQLVPACLPGIERCHATSIPPESPGTPKICLTPHVSFREAER